ncbi:MAG: SDR family NAD(P)-dependent oxidoreductase [Acetobacteraceae bacterium]|nr:SDR family NAD(P)-dependent oxidoreductase [Acetobacteraceae bacterium]
MGRFRAFAGMVFAVLSVVALGGCASTRPLGRYDAAAVSGRTYVLVGASSGFGQGVALDLARYGANLVLAGRRGDLLEEVANRVRATGAQISVVPTDISRPEDVQRLAAAAVGRFGKVDVWINFAGIGAIGRFWDIPVTDQARLLDVNLKGVLYASNAAIRIFRHQGYGTLINLGSIDSEVPLAYQAAYSASKAGVRGMDQALAQELRLAGAEDIHVVTVEPWAADTPWWGHAANYSGGTPRMAAMDDPWKVVRAIVWVSLHPRAELPVGWKAQASWFSHHLAPQLTEHVSANIADRYQIETAPPAPPTDGSLYQADPSGRGVEGGVRARMQSEDQSRPAAATP